MVEISHHPVDLQTLGIEPELLVQNLQTQDVDDLEPLSAGFGDIYEEGEGEPLMAMGGMQEPFGVMNPEEAILEQEEMMEGSYYSGQGAMMPPMGPMGMPGMGESLEMMELQEEMLEQEMGGGDPLNVNNMLNAWGEQELEPALGGFGGMGGMGGLEGGLGMMGGPGGAMGGMQGLFPPGPMTQEQMMQEYQKSMDKRNEMMQFLSNVEKSEHETKEAIIRNIGG